MVSGAVYITHVRERDNFVNNMRFFIRTTWRLSSHVELRELRKKQKLDSFIMKNKLVEKIVLSLEMLQFLREVGPKNFNFFFHFKGVCIP
jgi:hypothetical protein